jgi:phage shock protein PspC (stress-responsive transcriptional regulator)
MPKKKPSKKELTLSKDKKLLGVAGGIAEYFDTDPAWVRIIALVFIVLTGIIPGFIIYFIIGSVIMPEKKTKK